VNAYSIFNDIIENKDALGLTNTQSSACSGNAGLLPLPICNSGDPVVANVDGYIFFDKAHPTRPMHQYIGRFAVESIGQADTDGDGVPDATDLFRRNAGMDSFFDIGWRIWLLFTFIGTILFFIQRRNESNVNTKEWVQDTLIVADEQHDNKPKVAPSSERFE